LFISITSISFFQIDDIANHTFMLSPLCSLLPRLLPPQMIMNVSRQQEINQADSPFGSIPNPVLSKFGNISIALFNNQLKTGKSQ